MRLCRATRAAADAEEKARAERAAKRAAAKTRERARRAILKPSRHGSIRSASSTRLDTCCHSPRHTSTMKRTAERMARLRLRAAGASRKSCASLASMFVNAAIESASRCRVWRSPHRQAAAGCASPIRVRRGIAKGRGMSAACSRPLALRRLRRKTFGGSISWQRESLFPCSDACLRLSLGVVVACGCRSLFAILTLPPFPLPNPTRDITRHRARHVLCHAAP